MHPKASTVVALVTHRWILLKRLWILAAWCTLLWMLGAHGFSISGSLGCKLIQDWYQSSQNLHFLGNSMQRRLWSEIMQCLICEMLYVSLFSWCLIRESIYSGKTFTDLVCSACMSLSARLHTRGNAHSRVCLMWMRVCLFLKTSQGILAYIWYVYVYICVNVLVCNA